MAKQKKVPPDKAAARRRELIKQVKHPYITGQGLDRQRRTAEGGDRESGASPTNP
jgi:hypothetical protein